jgi:hypothetical protein
MSDFTIVTTDNPLRYRDGILSFWEKYLPGTPSKRFEWLSAGNPAGPAVWFLAFEHGTSELAGTVSLVPRQLRVGGTILRAGIMGDFMVGEQYRGFGPYLKLLRETMASRSSLGLDCIYTIPNPASRMACMRVGMKKVKDLYCFVRPLAMRFYVEKVLPGGIASVLGPLASAGLRLISQEMLVSPRGIREESLQFGAPFDELWRDLRGLPDEMVGDRSAGFLAWRYVQNPLCRFRLLTARENGAPRIEGFLVFAEVEKNKLEVYDILGRDDRTVGRLIAALIGVARGERRFQALYFRSPLSSHSLRAFKRFRFFNTKKALELYYVGRTDVSLESWDFVSGDRNI